MGRRQRARPGRHIAYNKIMALKVFDLQCETGHVFEGWFASREDYDSQRERGLLSCPVCDSSKVERRVSAARLNVSNNARAAASDAPEQAAPGEMARVQEEVMRHFRQVLRNTENVGRRFAEEARRIHEGDAPQRPIRGTATQQERLELAEDGIAATPIPAIFDDERLQ